MPRAKTILLPARSPSPAGTNAERNGEDKLIAAAKQGRPQLEELFAQERGDAAQRGVHAGGVVQRTLSEKLEAECRRHHAGIKASSGLRTAPPPTLSTWV